MKLKDCISLEGLIDEISMMDLRKGPGEIITQVELGKTFVIKRANKPIAILCKVPGDLTTVVNPDGSISYK